MRPLLRIVFALGIVAGLGGARQACAQSAYGYSGLQFGGASQSLYSYSMTDLDYVAQAYYGVLTDAYLYAGNNIVASSEGATNGGYVDLYYSTSINTSYWIQTNHWIYPIAGGSGMPNFSCVTPAWYQGSFGVSACGTGSSGTTYIGTSYASGDTYGSGPSISGLDETSYGTAQTGTSGYLIIYGSSLTNVDYGSTAVLIDGVTASLTYVNPYQLNVYYTIPGGAAAGGHTLTVTTPYGYTTATFQVYPISITTPSLSGGIEGFPFQQQLWASGGQPPYSWSMAPGSSLPAGLTLTAANGFLGGTPTTPGNAFSFTVQVTDSLGRAATQAYTIAIQGFTLGTVAPGVTGVAGGYTVTVPIPITWTLNFNYAAFQAAGGYLFGDCGTGGPEVALSYSFGGLYAVFNTGLYSGSFPCSVGLAIGALEIFVHISFNVQPVMTISMGNMVISTNSSDNPVAVSVGQQIPLVGSITNLPSGVAISSESWIVPGTTNGGFPGPNPLAVGAQQPTNFTQSSTTFYWVDAANSRAVTYSVYLSNGQTYSVSAAFNVVAPSAPTVTVNTGAPAVNTNILVNNLSPTLDPSGLQALIFAGIQNSPLITPIGSFLLFPPPASEGIVIGAQVTPPPGFAGSVVFVQLLNEDDVTLTAPGDQNGGCIVTLGLDHTFPYATVATSGPAFYLYDSPAVTLSAPVPGGGWSNIMQGAIRTFQATTYVMWQPSTPNSIPVPLGNVTWSFDGNAARIGTWVLDNSDPESPNPA